MNECKCGKCRDLLHDSSTSFVHFVGELLISHEQCHHFLEILVIGKLLHLPSIACSTAQSYELACTSTAQQSTTPACTATTVPTPPQPPQFAQPRVSLQSSKTASVSVTWHHWHYLNQAFSIQVLVLAVYRKHQTPLILLVTQKRHNPSMHCKQTFGWICQYFRQQTWKANTRRKTANKLCTCSSNARCQHAHLVYA